MCARSNSRKSLWPLGHRIHIVASFQVTSFLLKTAVWIRELSRQNDTWLHEDA